MKKWIMVMFSIVFCIYLSGLPMIAYGGHGMDEMGTVVARKFKGEVTGIDIHTRTISVKRGEIIFNAVFDEKTTIQKDKETKTVNDVKAGQKVTIWYFQVGGKNVAKSIIINP